MGAKRRLKQVAKPIHFWVTRFFGRLTGKYYFEDYVRVYPDGAAFNQFGIRRSGVQSDVKNFLEHQKFYRFAAQFVSGKRVADVGCGSGYGCEILKHAGAAQVCGADLSRHAIAFARSRFGHCAEFTIQPITDLRSYADDSFDVTVCSEVLEHIKEYGREEDAVCQLKRITRPGGLVVLGTPNTEYLPDHGFSFEEISHLMRQNFQQFLLFENALVPVGEARLLWERRFQEGKTGTVISERINLAETPLPETGEIEIKIGQEPGRLRFAGHEVDTCRLHNARSWVVVATK
jgi:2-polyprenyl-3-methyl-5-hydroxy-6-metoxy-1,4-benzoquinol methylase